MQRAEWQPEASPTFWINHASRLIMREFERRLRPFGYGFAYFPVIAALDQDGELLQRDLAERMHVEQPSMATLLARMERDGVVARQPHPDDKRKSRVALTRRTKARLPAARDALRDVVDVALSGFSAAEHATLIALLRRVIKNLEQARAK